MKGIIFQCAIDMVKDRFGDINTVNTILVEAGIPVNKEIVIFEDISDETCLSFIQAAAKILNITPDDLMLAFGDYWINMFAFKKYKIVYSKYKTAKEFLLGMDTTHMWATQYIKGASPPRFIFEELEDSILIIHYISSRNLDKIVEGSLIGVLNFFKEEGSVKKISSDMAEASCAFEITFQN